MPESKVYTIVYNHRSAIVYGAKWSTPETVWASYKCWFTPGAVVQIYDTECNVTEFIREGSDISMPEKLFTRTVAADIVELFEDLLVKHGIKVPSPEDDERDIDDDACLYGSTYGDLLDDVERVIIDDVVLPAKNPNTEVVFFTFNNFMRKD